MGGGDDVDGGTVLAAQGLHLEAQVVTTRLEAHEKRACVIIALEVSPLNPLILHRRLTIQEVAILILQHLLLHTLHKAGL